jgi:YD repeat-containing protein
LRPGKGQTGHTSLKQPARRQPATKNINQENFHVMKKLFLMAGTLLALTFTACKKEESNTQNPAVTNAPARLLKKITQTENGVVTVFNFTYEANGRLSSIKSTDNLQQMTLTYDAAGNLSGVEQFDEEFRNIYNYTYNNNVPVSATFKSWRKEAGQPDQLHEDDALTYTVENGLVTKIHLNMLQHGEQADFNLTYTNGNLTQVKDGNNVYTANFTWGNKRSPYPAISRYVLDQAGFSLQFFAKKELTGLSFDLPGTLLDRTVTTQFTYDAQGYPLTSQDATTTLRFEYQ